VTIQLTTKIHGGKELDEVLRQLPAELVSRSGGPVKLSLKKAAQPVYDDAVLKVPTKTGRLRNAIQKPQRHPRPKHLVEIYGVGVNLGKDRDDPSGAWYARIVEFNTSFLRTAMEKNRKKSTNIYATEMGTRIERIGKKIGNENARKVGAKVRKANQPTSVQRLLDYRPPT